MSAPTCWLEVSVRADAALGELTAAMLIDHGARGAEIRDEEGGCTVVAHWPDSPAVGEELGKLRAALHRAADSLECSLPDVQTRLVQAEHWEEAWRRHLPPQLVGRRWRIQHPWHDAAADDSRITVVIDPGMAFGTGQHATTRLMLELLEEYCGSAERVLDLGCGTGILAIAAAAMGARTIVAVDNDDLCVAAARDNAARNGASNIRVVQADLVSSLSAAFDLVCANLNTGLLMHLADDLHRVVAPGGVVLASGMLPVGADEVMRAWDAIGIELDERRESEGWTALAAHLRGA